MKVKDIFFSVQAESSWAGLPCIIIQLQEGNEPYTDMTVEEISDKVTRMNCGIVEFDHGSFTNLDNVVSIIKKINEVHPERIFHYLLKTPQTVDVCDFLARMDEEQLFQSSKLNYYIILKICSWDDLNPDNFTALCDQDEVGFLCYNLQDYEKIREIITQNNLGNTFVSVSGAHDLVFNAIITDGLRTRFQPTVTYPRHR